MRLVFLAAVSLVFALGLSFATPAHASPPLQADGVQGDAGQDTPELTIENLDSRLRNVEGNFPLPDPGGGILIFVLLLYAVFCALWAQNSGRNPWLWFFLGLIFSFITAFVILHKNAMDLQTNSKPKPKAKT